jgi:hypothetical protein
MMEKEQQYNVIFNNYCIIGVTLEGEVELTYDGGTK